MMMENFADIEGPVRIGLLTLMMIAAGVLLLCSGAALLLYRFLKRRKQGAPGPAVPQRSALEIAMERLSLLRNAKESVEAEPFTVEVSDVVRDYLESALEIPAREQTSEEFLLALQQRKDLPSILDDNMPAFLEQCDRVKFARQTLAGHQRDNLLQTAETVVESTDRHLKRPLNADEPVPAQT